MPRNTKSKEINSVSTAKVVKKVVNESSDEEEVVQQTKLTAKAKLSKIKLAIYYNQLYLKSQLNLICVSLDLTVLMS